MTKFVLKLNLKISKIAKASIGYKKKFKSHISILKYKFLWLKLLFIKFSYISLKLKIILIQSIDSKKKRSLFSLY